MSDRDLSCAETQIKSVVDFIFSVTPAELILVLLYKESSSTYFNASHSTISARGIKEMGH